MAMTTTVSLINSSALNCARAASYSSSDSSICGMFVTASAQASAARALSV
jgi:hypothetical protein